MQIFATNACVCLAAVGFNQGRFRSRRMPLMQLGLTLSARILSAQIEAASNRIPRAEHTLRVGGPERALASILGLFKANRGC